MYSQMRPQAHDPVRESVGDGSDDDDDEEKRTIFCANIDQRVSEEILFEVFLQAGPIESVRIPKDNGGRQKSFGFITYVHQCSVPFALQLLAGLSLFKKQLTIKPKHIKALPSDVEPLMHKPAASTGSEFIPMRAQNSPYTNETNPFKTDKSSPKGLGWTQGPRRSDELKKHSSHNSRPHQNTPYSRVDNSRDHGGGSGYHRNRHSDKRSRKR